MALEGIREIFELEEDEMVYESFECFQVGNMRKFGRLYITEEHICFYCNIVGSSSKNKKLIFFQENGKLV